MQRATIPPEPTDRTRERHIQTDIEIVPKGSCFVDEISAEITDITLQFPGDDCHSDVTVASDDSDREVDIVHHSGDRCPNCPGVIFSEYDLVPQFIDQDGEAFLVRTYLPADHQLSDLIEDLRRVSSRVSVQKIHDIRQSDVDALISELDLSLLTSKQRTAVERAVERGYYSSPPGVSLTVLADDFDVSESALSQRLSRAEETLMGQIFSR